MKRVLESRWTHGKSIRNKNNNYVNDPVDRKTPRVFRRVSGGGNTNRFARGFRKQLGHTENVRIKLERS